VLVDSRTSRGDNHATPRIIIAGIGLAAVAAVGGVTAASAAGSPASSAPAATASAAAATVRTAPAAVAGTRETILVTAHGLPLYFYRPDTAARSLVTGSLARPWPPLTSAAPTAARAGGKLTVLNDVNGHQVTYNGHPPYTFAGDHAGQVTGQGIQNFFVATPGLTPLTTSSAPAAPAAPSGGGFGY
jgi:predicted lipoprotein with Yx(FWY)xxD motif